MNWFIPAFVSRSPDSGGGISDDGADARVTTLLEEREEQSRGSGGRPSRAVYRGFAARAASGAAGSVRRVARRGARARARPARACPPRSTRRRACSGPAARPWPHARAPAGFARCSPACLVQRDASIARRSPPRPTPSATQNPRRITACPLARGVARSLALREPWLTPLRRPAPKLIDLHERAGGGLLDQPAQLLDPTDDGPGRLEHAVDPVDLAVRLLHASVRTSRSSGTVSSRMVSIIIFVLSSTRNVFEQHDAQEEHQDSPQNAARMISAVSPPVSASDAIVHVPPVRCVRSVLRGLLGRRVAYPGTASRPGLARRQRRLLALSDGS